MIKRDVSIDFLMLLAILLVVNSHMDGVYGETFGRIATGGLFGDALFFFCSGYKLFLGKMDGFVSWYRRRIVRIYPTIIVFDLLYALVLSAPLTVRNVFDGWKICGYWFVKCLMIHYVFIWLVRRFCEKHLKLVFAGVIVATLGLWCCAYSPRFAVEMTCANWFQWFYMFLFTLGGGCLAAFRRGDDAFSFLGGVSLAFGSLVAHYGLIAVIDRNAWLMPAHVVIIGTCAGVVYGLYMISKSGLIRRLMATKGSVVIIFLSSLSLEVYISNTIYIDYFANWRRPFNLICCWIVIFAGAYIVRCLTRFVLQILDVGKEIDFSKVFK